MGGVVSGLGKVAAGAAKGLAKAAPAIAHGVAKAGPAIAKGVARTAPEVLRATVAAAEAMTWPTDLYYGAPVALRAETAPDPCVACPFANDCGACAGYAG